MRETVDDQAAFRTADLEFHGVVMDISGNRLAESIARILMERALESWRYHGVDTPDAFAITLHEHEAIHAAITGQDAVRAQDAMNGHILDSWRRRRLPDHAGKQPKHS
ncbi:hypothetical protein GCM10027614_81530 [Micromonospora vulcania]